MKNLDRLKARATTVECTLASACPEACYLDICYLILEVGVCLFGHGSASVAAMVIVTA